MGVGYGLSGVSFSEVSQSSLSNFLSDQVYHPNHLVINLNVELSKSPFDDSRGALSRKSCSSRRVMTVLTVLQDLQCNEVVRLV